MALFDDAASDTSGTPETPTSSLNFGASPQFSDAAYGLDSDSAKQGEPSIFGSIGNFATKGVPLTALAIANSFANTAIEATNWLGANNDKLTVENELGPGAYNDYYQAHSQGIEFAALAAGSLIPGMAAIKVLKAARLGIPTNAFVRATNIFAGPQARIIAGATAEIEAGNGALFGGLISAKYQAIALGYGEQAVQSLVYEMATAATMKASPLLDQDGLSDTLDNMLFGALTGGAIGGTVEALGVRSLFKKAELFADKSTKAEEITSRLGKGPFLPGDRVADLIQSLDEIPEPSSVLGKAKLSRTRDAALLEARSILTNFVPEGDEVVGNKLLDTLLDIKNSSDQGRSDFYNYLSRLNSITRLNGPVGASDDAGAFYINRLSRADAATATFDDVVTPSPRYQLNTDQPLTPADQVTVKELNKQGVSLRYRKTDGAGDLTVGKELDTYDKEGNLVPGFASAKAAWAVGKDAYIAGDLKVYVNPDSKNLERVARPGESRPLTIKEEKYQRLTGQLPKGKNLSGAGLILDTVTKSVQGGAIPVVGDLGRVESLLSGVRYGNEFSPQELSSPITKDTSTIDANARYVWAKNRGIIAGDRIDVSDAAVLEQMYREGSTYPQGWDEYIKKLDRQGVSFSDGASLPATPKDMMDLVKGSKDQIVADTLANNSKLSLDEAARRANVSDDYIANKLQANSSSDLMVDPDQSAEVRHIRLGYDIGNIYQKDGMIMKGMIDTQYRISLIQQALRDQGARFFGGKADRMLLTAESKDADLYGAGSGFLSFASAGYRSLGQQAERVGREVTNWYQGMVEKINTTLTPAATALRNDDVAGAEMGMFRAVRQRTGESYSFLPPELAQAKGLAGDAASANNFAVLTRSIIRDAKGNITDWDKTLVPNNFIHGDLIGSGVAQDAGQTGNSTYYRLSDKVANFERASMTINNSNIQARNSLNQAWGISRRLPLDTLYTPPINISEANHFAMVKLAKGTGMGEDDVAVITAGSKDELEKKVAALQTGADGQYSVYYKDDLKKSHEVLGDYEYSRNFAQTQVNSAMQRNGILNDVYPETRASSIIQDYVDWHYRQAMLLTRDHVELGNGQLFAELRAMGEKFSASESSKAGFIPAAVTRSVDNPYDSYVKTALGVSPKETYKLWSETQERLESFFNTAFATAKNAFVDASKGILPYEEAAKMSEKFGLGNPYGSAIQSLASIKNTYENIANKLPTGRTLSNFISTANTILGATVIKLDQWQQLIHVLSTPILTMSEGNSFRGLLTTELPDGSGKNIPAVSKVMFQAVRDYFDTTKREAYLKLYQDNNFMHDPDLVRSQWQMHDELALPSGSLSESGFTTKLSNATAFAQKWLGTNASEQFTSWIAARVGHILSDAAGDTGQQLLDNIGTFVNRVKGNMVASQRPVAFQGPVGQAVGLFQTYQFNLMQNLFRFIENGEAKSVAILGAMQTTLFGLQGLPGFSAINNHIIGDAATNPLHKDAYSAIPNLLDKKLGDYLLYGVTSNILGAGLYTRGDINPRNLTLLPVNPLNYPAIAGGIRFMGSLWDTAKKISDGAPIASALLQGLEHNGLSRPLGGIATLAQGFSTTSQTGLVRAMHPTGDDNPGMSELFSAANFSRLAGARPLDEAITMDGLYRSTLYNAKDAERQERLGERVRSQMINGTAPSADDIASYAHQYQAAGGRVQEFGKSILKWTQEAEVGVANKVFYRLGDPRSQVAMQQMGGQQLPDFRNKGDISPAQIPANAKQAGDGSFYVPDKASSSGWSRLDPNQ